jgi:hypothetical protein
MKASLGLILALAMANSAAAADSASSKSHAGTLSGTVASIDTAHKSLVVRDGQGRQVQVVWTGATRVTGPSLKPGEAVTVRWMPRDGKKVATVVKVHAPAAETTAAATASPTSVSPTPKTP